MNLPNSAPVYFYFPEPIDIEVIPEVDGHYVTRRSGQYIWTVKTAGLLHAQGYHCALVDKIPEAGIIISHRDFLPNSLKPNAQQLLVCVVADDFRHPYAQLHILQNRRDPVLRRKSKIWKAEYIPHWTETGLVPRDPERGNALTTVGYFGLASRLEPKLRSPAFATELNELGYQFKIIDSQNWNDYSQIDVVLAVRSFAAVPFYRHPPSKLFNCWVAGVPALLGHESAYQAERQSEFDYVEVGSVAQIIAALRRLKEDSAWRTAMIENGAKRRAEVAPAMIGKEWIAMCEQVAKPALVEWGTSSDRSMRKYFALRDLAYRWYRFSDYLYRATISVRKQLARLA